MTSQQRRADETRVPLPSAADLVAMMDAGQTAAELGEVFGCSASLINRTIQDSGIIETRRWKQRRSEWRETVKAAHGALRWRIYAKCADYPDPDVFFRGEDTAEALVVCSTCPVRGECLGRALDEEGVMDLNKRFGVRGGMTAKQRWEIARARRDAKREAAA